MANEALVVGAGGGQGGLVATELCLGRRGGDKQEFGPPATTLGCVSPSLAPCAPLAVPSKGLKPFLWRVLGLSVISPSEGWFQEELAPGTSQQPVCSKNPSHPK